MHALIVDDDPSVVSVVGKWLEHAGYAVVACQDFPTAAFGLKSRPFDAVVVDVRLGEFNGLQIAHLARRARPETRIVVISGWTDPVLKRDAERLGAAYLVKPFNAQQLLDALARPMPIVVSVPRRAAM